jgi:hypothetical protein
MTNDRLIQEYLRKGGKITRIPSENIKRHSPWTKSHELGGRWGLYNVGGKWRQAALRNA